MLSINKHGIRKIKINVLSIIDTVIQNLNIKSLIKKTSQKHYWSKKDVKFLPAPPSAELCQNIVSNFCADTSPEVFEETGCAVCGKLTLICTMEELSEVENVSL